MGVAMPGAHGGAMGIRTGHRALRKGRVSVPGGVYLVTAACHGRRRCFVDFAAGSAACVALQQAAAAVGASLLAWVLMPDHWHGLLQLGETPLSTVVQRLHSAMARAANEAARTRGKVWQGAWHDHALRRDEDVAAAARYIVANPLRAGLVRRVGDYPF